MQVSDEVRKCVCFIAYQPQEGKHSLCGTGFFVSMPIEGHSDRNFVYLVTAKHVIQNIQKVNCDGKVWIRINTRQGGFKYIPTLFADWKDHSDDSSVDAMVLQVGSQMDMYDFLTLPLNIMVTKEVIENESIGVGDEIFLTGLFISHSGKKKNMPIVRVGNIAAMPEEAINVSNFGDIEAYLIEARSIGGLSGSPVFVHLASVRVKDNQAEIREQRFYWLGLMHGHWNLPINSEKPRADEVVEDFSSKEAVNMGIAIVIPSIKIFEIINQSFFVESRDKEIKKLNNEP